MQRTISSIGGLACLVALAGSIGSVRAAEVTYVSVGGDDSATCLSPAVACRQISAALTKTDPLGTIHVAPGHYGAFTIAKSVDILADGGLATITDSSVSIPGGGDAAIVVNGDVIVRIRGFHLNAGVTGVAFVGSDGILHLEDSVLVPTVGRWGVDFRPSGANELYLSDSIIASGSDPGGGGVRIGPGGSSSPTTVLDNVRIEHHAAGVLIDGRSSTGANNATVRNGTVLGGALYGIYALDIGGGSTNVVVEFSNVTDHQAQGVVTYGSDATLRMRDSTVSGNSRGVQATGGSQLISLGGNAIAGNGFDGAFTSTVAQK